MNLRISFFIRTFIFLFMLLNLKNNSTAQVVISPEHEKQLNLYQDSLEVVGDSMIDAKDEMVRQSACFQFIKMLVRALRVEQSFYFSFDSLDRISILQPADNTFKIFTWALRFEDSTYRYYGTIQMNDPKGLKLYPLFDNSPFIEHPEDSLMSNEKWFGVLYYRMIEEQNSQGKPYYFLLGWDGNDKNSNKKLIEVLSFNSKKQPVFGASMFFFGQYDTRNKVKRVITEYKEDARVSLNYDEELQMIITDHLQPESTSTKDDRSTYVPDGTYEGFKWENGKWHYVENVFTSTQQQPPFPDPVDFDKEKNLYKPKK